MVKKEIAKSLTTLKEMCLANNCNDCPLGFRMLVNYTVYYKYERWYCVNGYPLHDEKNSLGGLKWIKKKL